MTDRTTVLAIIRYPLTLQSTRTLTHATDLVHAYEYADLHVLHVNLVQNGKNARADEVARAIAPLLNDPNPSVTVRRGFLVEEIISDEAERMDADVIVLQKDDRSRWRRFLARLIGNDPAIVPFLRERTNAEIEVVG